MFERDYILRMFQLLGQGLERIIFFREIKEYDKALTEIDNSARTILGLNMDMIERMPIAGLKDLVGSDPSLVGSKLYTAGVLLKEKGEIAGLQGDEDGSVILYLRSLSIFMEDISLFKDFDDEKSMQAIDFVIGRLKDYEIPGELKKKLASYFEETGKYSKMDDIIFEIIGDDAAFVPNGISAYERLLQKSDAKLADGQLPRSEVEDSLAELRKHVMDS